MRSSASAGPRISDIYRLRIFVEVAEQRSFSRAAQRLFLTQPAVSKNVGALEQAVGHPLFDQRRHNLRLTEVGEALVERARKLILEMESIETTIRDLSGEMAGLVRLSCNEAWVRILPELLMRFQVQNPKVALRLTTGEEPEMAEHLLDDRLDLAFSTQASQDSRVEVETVSADEAPWVVIVPTGHPLAGASRLEPAMLREFPFVHLTAGSPASGSKLFANLGIAPRKVMELSRIEWVLRAVEQGCGITVMYEFAIRFAGSKHRLVQIPLDVPPAKYSMVIGRNRARYQGRTERALVDYIKANFPPGKELRLL